MKKVALVLDGLGIGGIERVAADYSKIFNNLGYEVTVINLVPEQVEMKPQFSIKSKFINFSFSRKEAPEQYAQFVKRYWWGRYLYPVIFTILQIWIILKKIFFKLKYRLGKYDVVISFASHFNDLTFVANNFVKADKKLSWLHGALYGYALISDGYLNLYNKIHNLVVLVDDAQKETLTYNKQLDLNINKLYNPTYFTNDNVSKEKIKELRSKYGNYLLMVARFSYPHKDHYTVIKAFSKIVKTVGDINLVLVGDGPEMEKVRKYTANFGKKVSEKVYFIGATNDVKEYYAAAKILVHASVAGEGLPTVILEALSQSIPVVSTDSKVGPREILGNNEYGLLSGVEDPDDMAKKVIGLLSNSQEYNKYVVAGSERIKAFHPKVIENKLENILETID